MQLIDLIGFIGAALLLWAFIQSSRNKWHGNDMAYLVVNMLAGTTLAYYTYEKQAYFATFINVTWALIAVVGYIRLVRKKK